MNIKTVREYMENINLEDYELGGVEITEDDFKTVLSRVNDGSRSLEDVVHEYLIEIREVLDMGLDTETDFDDSQMREHAMKKIKVYDIDAFVAQEYPEYEPFRYKKAAIFEGPRGVVFAEEEAVHQKENTLTDSVVVPLAKRTDDKHIAIFATADMTVSLDELVAKAPFEEMSMDEFFARRNYNPRCQDNYATLMGSLRKIGFDLDGYFEKKPSVDEQVQAAAEKASANREKPDCPLIGQDGNIFNLMAIASKTLKKNDMADQATEMCDRIQKSGSYDEALCILGEYVNITSVDKKIEDRDVR